METPDAVMKDAKESHLLEDTTQICREIQILMSDLIQLKSEGRTGEFEDKIMQGSALLLQLRHKNREVQNDIDSRKTIGQSEKTRLEERMQEVSNCAAERDYLKQEIERCRNFKSQQKQVHMISEEDFLKKAPTDLTTASDPHQIMLNRFRYELQQRKDLGTKIEELKFKKRALEEQNRTKKKKVDGFDAHLKAITKVSKDAQDFVQLDTSLQLRKHEKASFLPLPLYTLYYYAIVTKDSYNVPMEVRIVENNNLGNQKLDPACIEFQFSEPQMLRSPKIVFYYHAVLDIILTHIEDGPLQQSQVLVDLIHDDSGDQNPNPKTQNENSDLGNYRAFKWAQWLGGLDFIQEPIFQDESRLTRVSAFKLIFKLKNRIVLHQSIISQLNQLSNKTSFNSAKFQLATWMEISPVAYQMEFEDGRDPMESTSHHIFYKGEISAREKDASGFTVFVDISTRPPFKMNFKLKYGSKATDAEKEEGTRRENLVNESQDGLAANIRKLIDPNPIIN
eukprot:TRINITY_DN259_c4_g2_i1.p1 TRINITY_DN259_c4_g2~~TRINITY_DN259_c4_g2_i1.p1  ORF type:complete len:507 (-),score=155.38 TRINITY_DN259_c4_g2_i1:37-1557(-)